MMETYSDPSPFVHVGHPSWLFHTQAPTSPQCLHGSYLLLQIIWTLAHLVILQTIFISDGIQSVCNIPLGISFHKKYILQGKSKNKGRKKQQRLAYRKSLHGLFGENVCVGNTDWPTEYAAAPLGPGACTPEKVWIRVDVAWHWCFLLEVTWLMTFTSSLLFLAPCVTGIIEERG